MDNLISKAQMAQLGGDMMILKEIPAINFEDRNVGTQWWSGTDPPGLGWSGLQHALQG